MPYLLCISDILSRNFKPEAVIFQLKTYYGRFHYFSAIEKLVFLDEIEKVLGKSLPIIILRNTAKHAILEDKYLRLLSK